MEEKDWWCGGKEVGWIDKSDCADSHESHLENGVEAEYCKTHKKFREIKYKQVK